jgi:DNA-directed RNA polymerase specialized sigma54-like protein
MRTEQRLIQSPQMIQAMKILQCPMHDLLEQIEQELSENVFLEVVDETEETPTNGEAQETTTEETEFEESIEAQISKELDQLEERIDDYASVGTRPNQEDADRRYEMLLNTADSEATLSEYLLEQVGVMDIRDELAIVVEHLVFSLDNNGRSWRAPNRSRTTSWCRFRSPRKRSRWCAVWIPRESARALCKTA